MQYVNIGGVKVSRFIIGSNPFSGFSHQGVDRDEEMMRYYTARRIVDTLHEAQSLGINTVIARTDHHVMRTLLEFFNEGGRLQWFAQTCPEVGSQEMCIDRAVKLGAQAVHIHGGWMDWLWLNGRIGEVKPLIERIRGEGLLAAVAGHRHEVIEWARDNLELDYFMTSYYNPIPRDKNPLHVSGLEEIYDHEHRRVMTGLVQTLPSPAIHYKVLAAGRNDPATALRFCASCLRENDAVCAGVYTGDKPGMLKEDIDLLEESLAAAAV